MNNTPGSQKIAAAVFKSPLKSWKDLLGNSVVSAKGDSVTIPARSGIVLYREESK